MYFARKNKVAEPSENLTRSLAISHKRAPVLCALASREPVTRQPGSSIFNRRADSSSNLFHFAFVFEATLDHARFLSAERARVIYVSLYYHRTRLGKPLPALVWWHDGRIVDDNFTVLEGERIVRNELRVHNVRRPDLLKKYVCTAANSALVAPQQASVTLDINRECRCRFDIDANSECCVRVCASVHVACVHL